MVPFFFCLRIQLAGELQRNSPNAVAYAQSCPLPQCWDDQMPTLGMKKRRISKECVVEQVRCLRERSDVERVLQTNSDNSILGSYKISRKYFEVINNEMHKIHCEEDSILNRRHASRTWQSAGTWSILKWNNICNSSSPNKMIQIKFYSLGHLSAMKIDRDRDI